MTAPFFSILVTVYNVEKYLSECLDSVILQDFRDYEVIIVDDGSTDSSAYIAEQYANKDSRFKVYCKENQGVLLARKYAYEKSCGKYILNIDSDDLLDKELLSTVKKEIDQTGCQLLMYDLKIFTPDGKENIVNYLPDKKIFYSKDKAELYNLLLTTKINSLCTKVYSRDIADIELDYIKFTGLKHGEDFLQSAYIVANSDTTVYINKPLYIYRKGVGAAKKFDEDSIVRASEVADVVMEIMKAKKLDTEKNKKEFGCMCRKKLNSSLNLMNDCKVSLLDMVLILKKASKTNLYKSAISKNNDYAFTKSQNFKFLLLRKHLILLACFLQKIKN